MNTPKLPPLPEPSWPFGCKYNEKDMQAYALAAIAAQGVPDGLFESQIEPRPLLYPLSDYHKAMTEGPLHYTWIDKPHRLVYDLIAAVRYYASAPPAPQSWPLPGWEVQQAAPIETAACAERDARIAELERQLAEAGEALNRIGDFAHDKSTGPAIPDALWEIRSMAYSALTGPIDNAMQKG